jgi:hypothetical protein
LAAEGSEAAAFSLQLYSSSGMFQCSSFALDDGIIFEPGIFFFLYYSIHQHSHKTVGNAKTHRNDTAKVASWWPRTEKAAKCEPGVPFLSKFLYTIFMYGYS